MKKLIGLLALVFVFSSFTLKKVDVVGITCTDVANFAYLFSLEQGFSNEQANTNYNNAFWNCCNGTAHMCKDETVIINSNGSNSGSD